MSRDPRINCTRLAYLMCFQGRSRAADRKAAYGRMADADPQIHRSARSGAQLLATVLPLLSDEEKFVLATEATRMAAVRVSAILEIADKRGLLA